MNETSPELWDKNYVYYQQLAELLSSIAGSHYDVDIDEETLLRWRDLMGIMREIDTKADDSGASHDEVLRELADFTVFEERYPNVRPQALGQETFDKLVARTRKILKLGEFVSKATTESRYIKLRAAEGIATAEVFSDSATQSVLDQNQFGDKFIPLLKTMAVSSGFIDSAHDLKQDYAEGKTALRPHYGTRVRLAAIGLGMCKEILPAAFHTEVVKQTIEATKQQQQRRSN
jgi:hypothetical protein